MSVTIVAEHPAICPECGSYIRVGDTVTKSGMFAQWQHQTCPKTAYDFDPADVCPECFTVRSTNGKCAC